MSAIGSIVGIQEGIEAGLVTGGLSAAEKNHSRKLIALGLGATAAGVALGHTVGESALEAIDQYIGDGGVGFLPALAIGSTVMWHNLRTQPPQKSMEKLESRLPIVIGAGFAAFEGTESGILTSATQTGLLSAETVTLASAATAVAAFAGAKKFAGKVSPKNALRYARGIALVPAAYIGANAAPELLEEPKAAGVTIAALGVVAMGGAVKSFFKRKPVAEAAPQPAE